ncbi:MAG: hypothetical protein CMJ31_02830 [Phycisphaerae bacterium]|nr:hypothetical protein [Phycisphaerae bacterium]
MEIPPVTWFHRLRLRVLAIVLAGGLAVFAMISWLALPALPVIGVAVITVAAVVNTVTHRLASPVCWQCGEDIGEAPKGVHGAMCRGCGAVNQQVGTKRA